MKKVWIVCLAMALFSMMTAAALSAQVYVRVRPAVPVYVRATPPGAGYIWIGEDWEWRGGTVHTCWRPLGIPPASRICLGAWSLAPHKVWMAMVRGTLEGPGQEMVGSRA